MEEERQSRLSRGSIGVNFKPGVAVGKFKSGAEKRRESLASGDSGGLGMNSHLLIGLGDTFPKHFQT